MSYQLLVKPTAEKELARLPKSIAQRIAKKLSQIELEPRLSGSVKLAGSQSTYRVRVGDYRIVYEVGEKSGTITITIIAHRREVYRHL